MTQEITKLRIELMKDFGVNINQLQKCQDIEDRDAKLLEICSNKLAQGLNSIGKIRSRPNSANTNSRGTKFVGATRYKALQSKIIQQLQGKKQSDFKPQDSLKWDSNLENQFQTMRKKARQDLSKYTVSTSMNDVTINSIRRSSLSSRNKENKPYMSDRSIMKSQLRSLKGEKMDQLELLMANKIILDYTKSIDFFKQKRLQFLQQKICRQQGIRYTKKFHKSVQRQSKSVPKAQPVFKNYLHKIIKIQAWFRGYLTRKNLRSQNQQYLEKDIDQKISQMRVKTLPLQQRHGLSRKQIMLFLVIKQNDLKSLKSMSHNISTNDINIKDPCGNTPMYYAALKSNLLMVVYIWSLGGRLNIKCQNGETELHAAFQADNLEIVYFLLEKGSKLNIFTDDQMTPLDFASTQTAQKLNLDVGQHRGRLMDCIKLMEVIRSTRYEALGGRSLKF